MPRTPVDLRQLRLETFAPRVGEAFTLVTADAGLPWVLTEARAVAGGTPERDAFSLVFDAPPDPLLAQGIQRVEHPEIGALEVFLVPIARDAERAQYQAIFA